MHNLLVATALERLQSRNVRQAIREFKLYKKLSNIDTAPGIENIATYVFKGVTVGHGQHFTIGLRDRSSEKLNFANTLVFWARDGINEKISVITCARSPCGSARDLPVCPTF